MCVRMVDIVSGFVHLCGRGLGGSSVYVRVNLCKHVYVYVNVYVSMSVCLCDKYTVMY